MSLSVAIKCLLRLSHLTKFVVSRIVWVLTSWATDGSAMILLSVCIGHNSTWKSISFGTQAGSNGMCSWVCVGVWFFVVFALVPSSMQCHAKKDSAMCFVRFLLLLNAWFTHVLLSQHSSHHYTKSCSACDSTGQALTPIPSLNPWIVVCPHLPLPKRDPFQS